ncbi:MAG: Kelch repeat-containing protein, partial [Candidatus Heimdallarchaeaceae archaeon]
ASVIEYPSKRCYHSLVYDSINDRIIMFGGELARGDSTSYVFDTWAYDFNSNNWTKLNPTGDPYGAVVKDLAFDSESEMIISYGGFHAKDVSSNQTWVFDYTSNIWTKSNPSLVPGFRAEHAMAYDSESDVVIMFAGGIVPKYNPYGDFVQYNDTLAYDFNTETWTNMTPAVSPLGRSASKIAYDVESDRIILFGGYHYSGYPFDDPTGAVYQKDTWAYDYNTNTWENITTTITPNGRIGFDMSYDLESDRIILFGGYTHLDFSGLQDETWAFDYNNQNWTLMNPASNLVRIEHQLDYDSESDRIILFGGYTAESPFTLLDETWMYDYNANNWTQILKKTPEVTPTKTNFYIFSLIVSIAAISILKIRRRK